MDLFDILSDDERIIVLSSKQDGCIVTWNQSLTLQCWQYSANGQWEETDMRILGSEPASFADASFAAEEWLAGNNG